MASRNPGEPTDPAVNESGEDEAGSPLTDATPVDVSAPVINGADPPMTVAGEPDGRRGDDGESRAEDAVNESASGR